MSDINYKQRCAIKFCVKLGYNATETFSKLMKAYKDKALSRAEVFGWFKAFQMVGHELRMIHAPEDRQRQELATMLIESGTWCCLLYTSRCV